MSVFRVSPASSMTSCTDQNRQRYSLSLRLPSGLSSTYPSPSSFSACRKYRPSVQHSAVSFVITAQPADPVKDVMYARRESHGARYSDASWKLGQLVVGLKRARSKGSDRKLTGVLGRYYTEIPFSFDPLIGRLIGSLGIDLSLLHHSP